MLSVSAETELDSSSISENVAEVKASEGAHTHYYGEYSTDWDECDGWYSFVVHNDGNGAYSLFGDVRACQYMQLTMDMSRMKEMKRMVLFGLETIRPQ